MPAQVAGRALAERVVTLMARKDPMVRAHHAQHPSHGGAAGAGGPAGTGAGGKRELLYIPEVVTVQPNTQAVLKGYLNLLESRDNGWRRKFLSIRKPYVYARVLFPCLFACLFEACALTQVARRYIGEHEKDPVVRQAIHISHLKVQYSEDQGAMMGLRNVFTLCTRHRGLLLQAVRCWPGRRPPFPFADYLLGRVVRASLRRWRTGCTPSTRCRRGRSCHGRD